MAEEGPTTATPYSTKTNSKQFLSEEQLNALFTLVASAASDSRRFLSLNDLLLHPSQTLTLESSIKSAAISLSKLHSILTPKTLTLESSNPNSTSPQTLALESSNPNSTPPQTLALESFNPNSASPQTLALESSIPNSTSPQILTLEAPNSTVPKTLTLEPPNSTIPQTLTLESLNSTIPKTLTLESPNSSWFSRLFSGPDSDWPRFFRVSKPGFYLLLQTLSPSLGPSADCAVAAALFRLAHAAPYNSVAQRFGFGSSSVACREFHRVVKAVLDNLPIHLELLSDTQRIIQGFDRISLPNCCGALGFHRFFTNRGSVVVQGLVDSDGRFLDVSGGWPGSMDPDSILRETQLFSRIENLKELLNGPCFELSSGDSIRQYVIGGSCCPLLPWLITPFSNEIENSSHRAFNSVHGKGISLVGTAFGRVSARWQLLSAHWKEECLEFFPIVIMAACLLHNFLTKYGDPPPEEAEEVMGEQMFLDFRGEGNEEGERLRNALALQLNVESDLHIVKPKHSGKRVKPGRELWNRRNKSTKMWRPLDKCKSKPPRRCHNCNGYGHDMRNCVLPRKDKEVLKDLKSMPEQNKMDDSDDCGLNVPSF